MCHSFHFRLSESGPLSLSMSILSIAQKFLECRAREMSRKRRCWVFKDAWFMCNLFMCLKPSHFQLLTGLLCFCVLAHAVPFVWNTFPPVLWLLKYFLSSRLNAILADKCAFIEYLLCAKQDHPCPTYEAIGRTQSYKRLTWVSAQGKTSLEIRYEKKCNVFVHSTNIN